MARQTILVVDDDKHQVELIQQYLEAKGFNVETGSTGQMVQPKVRSCHPSLIILDVDMPMMNGLQALEMLRSDPGSAQVPVVLLTGVASGAVYPAIQGMPRVTHLKKPLSLEDLESVIRIYLPSTEAP